MADDTLSGEAPTRSWRDWPADGEVRPQLISRLEWRAKGAVRELRRRIGRIEPAPTHFDLGVVYSTRSDNRTAPGVMLKRMFRHARDPEQAVDISFAALILAIASGDRPRAEGLAAFLPLCYTAPELDEGVARMRPELEALAPAQRASLGDLDRVSDWAEFVVTAGRRIDSMAAAGRGVEARRIPSIPPRRVVVRISGGLGNQMFQYAAALGYARRIGAPLRLDLANYVGDRREREFLLGRLRVPVRRANSFEVVWTRLRPHRQRGMALDEFLFEDNGSAWLSGFWENKAYFAEIVATVRRRFVPRDPAVIEQVAALVERARVGGGPVIGVHLRRGDRGPGGSAFAPFSNLPAGYYREAARRFPPDANFLVFSDTPDDIAWCRSHLGLGDSANVSFGEGRDPIVDMFALVNCDHVVLSGGTFSWWAGYLGDQPGRRVIVPNVLQGLSLEWATLAAQRPLPGWEELTVPPGSS